MNMKECPGLGEYLCCEPIMDHEELCEKCKRELALKEIEEEI